MALKRFRPLFPAALALIALSARAGAPGAPAAEVVDVDGMIHPITTDIISSAIAEAEAKHATVVVVRLNTPGGLMDAMRESIQKIVASPIPVITYVAPSGGRAASAGFFILESGDLAVMAPGTNTGAAHPVAMGGEMDATMKEKVENDAAAYMRSISAKRGHNADAAETAVRQSKSFTDREALNQNMIDLVEPNVNELLKAVDGRTVTRFDGRTTTLHTAGADVTVYQPSLRQRVMAGMADPNIAFILLIVGALLIYVEFTQPGMFAPGVIGAILVLLGLSALSVLPINWLGAALMMLAFVLFVLEAKFPTHGILGVGGAVSMLLGALMLIKTPNPEMHIHLMTALAVTIPFSAITMFLVSLAVRAHQAKVETGQEGMIGETGSALTELAPAGMVFVHGEYWNAVAARPVPAGARVRVTAIQRLQLTVEADTEQTGPGGATPVQRNGG